MPEELSPLIQKARDGDRDALEQLLVGHMSDLRSHVARGLPARLRGRIDVEDIVQETLTQAFLKVNRIRNPSAPAFMVWLWAIADMSLIDLSRRVTAKKRGGDFRKRNSFRDSVASSLVEMLDNLPAESATPSQAAARQEGISALQVAIASLPEDQRLALQLHTLEGKTLDETAHVMNRTNDAVRSLIHRAQQKLAQTMGRASTWLSSR